MHAAHRAERFVAAALAKMIVVSVIASQKPLPVPVASAHCCAFMCRVLSGPSGMALAKTKTNIVF
jgi:hypothetical protein